MDQKTNTLIIKQEHVLPFIFRLFSVAVFFFLLYHLIFNISGVSPWIVFGVIMYLCFVAFVSRYYVEFDMEKKEYFRYALIAGLRLGTKRPFNYIEKLYVNRIALIKENNYGPMLMPNEFRNTIFKCFLKFDDGEKIELDSDPDKDRLFNRLKKYNRFLRTSIFDTTTHQAILIESREND